MRVAIFLTRVAILATATASLAQPSARHATFATADSETNRLRFI
jgi:hypothetical protein